MKIENTFTISDAECVEEKEDRILVDAPDFDEPEWVFKDQLSDDSEVYKNGTSGDLIVSERFAERKGWV